ncbi:cell envelope integrity protein TolA, partial [Paraphotobacterium marinum]
KAAAEKAKKDAAAKAAAEKAKQEAAAKAKELDSVFQGLASEKNQLSAAKKSEKQSTIAYYRDKYIALIEAKFITRPSYNGKTCTLNFRMSASGRVISAIPQSGPQDLCQDAQVAIRKVGVFPMPEDAELSKEFQNGWTLNFSPSTN